MWRALPPLIEERRMQVFHATLARRASVSSSISVELRRPSEFLVGERVTGAAQFSPCIRESFPRARPNPLDVDRDRDATYCRANSAKLLGILEAADGAGPSEGRSPSAENTLSPRENKRLIGNRLCHAAIARGWQTAEPQKNFLRARRLHRARSLVQPSRSSLASRTASPLQGSILGQSLSWTAEWRSA